MKLFYTDLKEIIEERIRKPELKRLQSRVGYALVDYVGRNFYNLENTDLIIQNSKPRFQNAEVCFNISHSNEIVAVAFDEKPLGLDVELIKPRDLEQLSVRYGRLFETDEEFCRFWTNLEAEIKIQAEVKNRYTNNLTPEYVVTILSSNETRVAKISAVKIPASRLALPVA